MSTCSVALAGQVRRKSSGKSVSRNLVGGIAIAGLVIGCGWTVYTNILSASVYPTLGSAGFNEPVMKHTPPKRETRSAAQAVNEAFAAFPNVVTRAHKPAAVASITPEMFNQRFAAAEPDSVASNAANGAPPEAPKVAEAQPKKPDAPKLAEAVRPKETPRAKVAMNMPAPVTRPAESRPAERSSGFSMREMAQRAKAAVMSIASNDHMSMTEKLWGREPHSPLLSYASADASVTGSIGREQNPMFGGSPPYDRDTAVYDISRHMVYLPDGTRLEAHSGLGDKLDDPHSAPIRMRGVTPPNIYELKPREALFHGVPALRLNPIGGERTIYGREGLLAHTYMLGPNGDSNGCVSFRDYNAFLNAYRNEGIRKLAVVARVE